MDDLDYKMTHFVLYILFLSWLKWAKTLNCRKNDANDAALEFHLFQRKQSRWSKFHSISVNIEIVSIKCSILPPQTDTIMLIICLTFIFYWWIRIQGKTGKVDKACCRKLSVPVSASVYCMLSIFFIDSGNDGDGVKLQSAHSF